MGKFTSSGGEQAQTVLSGSLSATSATPTSNAPFLGNFNLTASGTFVGTVELVCSFDGGTTWVPALNASGAAITLTAAGSLQLTQYEPGVLYGVICTAYTSGAINWRLSEGASAGRVERLS